MAQLRDIKDRIDSVIKTKKMTQAMKMVAASKFRKATERVLSFRPYLKEKESLLKICVSQSDSQTALMKENNSNKHAVILITGDKGLCGGFNTNIIKKASRFLSEESEVELFLLGAKGIQFFKSNQYETSFKLDKAVDQCHVQDIEALLEDICNRYISGEYGKVWLFYNEFKTALSSVLSQKQILPVSVDTLEGETPSLSYYMEPNADSLLAQLTKEALVANLYRGVLESVAAEQGARMTAMDAATSNAGEMIKELTMQYNRLRQAQITTEIAEIVAGAEALVN